MIAKYIAKEKLLQKLSRMIEYCKNDNKVNGLTALFQVGDAIMDCPTADVVEIVRCRDCVHRDPEDKKCNGVFQAKGGIFQMDDDDFCSYGERKKENGEIY